VLTAIRQNGGDLKTLLGGLTLYPQKLINVPVSKRFFLEGSSGDCSYLARGGTWNGRAGRVLAARLRHRAACCG
jgi:phosphoglucosamine mutase